MRGRCVTLFAKANAVGYTRVGLTVTRKLGNAVERNRVKRKLRELFRLHQLRERGGLDVVVNAHHAFLSYSKEQIEEDFLRCFDRIGK